MNVEKRALALARGNSRQEATEVTEVTENSL
jgi:hypothetical protein